MQNDFEEEEMDFNNPVSENPGSPPKKWSKKHFLKFGLVFLGILILVAGGLLIWDGYLSPSAQVAHQAQVNYQKYLDQRATYEAAMKADTYGGATPQETLGLFETALKNGDVDLASNYFLLDDDGAKNQKVIESIKQIISDNKSQTIIDTLKKLVPSTHDTGDINTKDFVVLDQKGYAEYSVTLKLNKYSNVWKIENM